MHDQARLNKLTTACHHLYSSHDLLDMMRQPVKVGSSIKGNTRTIFSIIKGLLAKRHPAPLVSSLTNYPGRPGTILSRGRTFHWLVADVN